MKIGQRTLSTEGLVVPHLHLKANVIIWCKTWICTIVLKTSQRGNEYILSRYDFYSQFSDMHLAELQYLLNLLDCPIAVFRKGWGSMHKFLSVYRWKGKHRNDALR